MKKVIIIGAGLAGLSATLELAKENAEIILVSNQPSERAQSVMAEGGMNAAMNTKGEDDSPAEHAKETLVSAAGIVNEDAVMNMANAAPDIVKRLIDLGVNFNMDGYSDVDLRKFGGQKKRRTVFAGNCTGKQIMTALIDAVRKEEAEGNVKRYSHHEFLHLIGNDQCEGCVIQDTYTRENIEIKSDAVVMACGGMHGLFDNTTGSAFNTGMAVVRLFSQGVAMSNLEMIQFHPTTISQGNKRMLITEAARGEGGRLYSLNEDGKKNYFMEERFPEFGNLMPRDITAIEIYKELQNYKVYLDMTELDQEIWENRLFELRSDMKFYFKIDPAKQSIQVEPGIHYFMGGILVDIAHRTNIKGLYAAGECAAQYHGANRLGGNSLLGAIYGGMTAAKSIISDEKHNSKSAILSNIAEYRENVDSKMKVSKAMGIIRTEDSLKSALESLEDKNDEYHVFLKAILMSALMRKESRGVHFREDYPQIDPEYAFPSVAWWDGRNINVRLKKECELD
jgi:succinate dehydrogenase / fumarate reductase flavoprotein subunit